MKNIGIYYGSTTGTCESLPNKIASAFGLSSTHVKSASEFNASAASCDVLLLGTSTWGEGDIQDDWYPVLDTLKGLDLTGKLVAIFGCGDSASYPDSFCGGMRELYDAAKAAGATMVKGLDASEYSCSGSSAIVDGTFVGLAIDEDNEPGKTDGRIAAWIKGFN